MASMRHRYALFAVLLPMVGACSADRSSEASSPVVATTQTSVATAEATTTVAATQAPPTEPLSTIAIAGAAENEGAVAIADFAFTPGEVSVPVGGSVVWTNNDDQPHTATSAGAFDSGSIQPQTSVTVAFVTAGTFAYICSFHPFMTGMVVVA